MLQYIRPSLDVRVYWVRKWNLLDPNAHVLIASNSDFDSGQLEGDRTPGSEENKRWNKQKLRRGHGRIWDSVVCFKQHIYSVAHFEFCSECILKSFLSERRSANSACEEATHYRFLTAPPAGGMIACASIILITRDGSLRVFRRRRPPTVTCTTDRPNLDNREHCRRVARVLSL